MSRERIISLVPSLTELVFALNRGGQLAGRTRFCIHPEDEIGSVPVIGGTKNPRIDKIRALNPGLVIANREENRQEDVTALKEFTEVLVTDITTVDAALSEIQRVGDAINAGDEASALVRKIEHAMEPPGNQTNRLHRDQVKESPGKQANLRSVEQTNLPPGDQPHPPSGELMNLQSGRQANLRHGNNAVSPVGDLKPVSALYLIWRDPWMAAGGDTYIHDVMRIFGLRNVCAGRPRYPKLTIEEIRELAPDVILLSSEPYPFRMKHADEISALCPGSQAFLVNGEWFSWYGPRMVPSFPALAEWRRNL